jgi:hypothetical protein
MRRPQPELRPCPGVISTGSQPVLSPVSVDRGVTKTSLANASSPSSCRSARPDHGERPQTNNPCIGWEASSRR